MKEAIVYIPPDLQRDGAYAIQGVAHIAGRGYQLRGVYRERAHVNQLLRARAIQVIVCARWSHWNPRDWEGADVEVEYVGEETRRLTSFAANGDAVTRRLDPTARADRVRQVMEDSGPIPTGLDPESIAAARRIWKHYGEHGCA